MADDQIQQHLLQQTFDQEDRIPASLATGENQFLVSDGESSWLMKTLAQVKALLGLSAYVPYTGATDDVDLGTHDLAAGTVHIGGVDGEVMSEADTGYMVHGGDAGGYFDIKFPHGVPKTTGPGNPSLATYLGNLRGYEYQIDDAHDFDPQEYDHILEVGADFIWHIHMLSRANDGTDRYIKFELEASYSEPTGVETLLPLGEVEIVIPAGTTALTTFVEDIMTTSLSAIGPAWLLSARLKRVTASGAAPSVHPIVKCIHAHAKIDTPQGSREVWTK